VAFIRSGRKWLRSSPECAVGLGAGCWFPTFVFAFALGFGDSFALAFKHHLPLELGHRADDVQHEASSRSLGVQTHVEDTRGRVFAFYASDDIHKGSDRPGQPIELCNHQHVAITDVAQRGRRHRLHRRC
jgi:hypothetical protein